MNESSSSFLEESQKILMETEIPQTIKKLQDEVKVYDTLVRQGSLEGVREWSTR